MATSALVETIEDEKFQNWLKGALALLFAKQGLDDFVTDELSQFQTDLLECIFKNKGIPAGTVCNSCSTENILPCPTPNFCPRGRCRLHDHSQPDKFPNQPCPRGICQDIRDGISREHRYNGPSWKNTNGKGWCIDAFEIAKCFMPPDGYATITSLADTDFNGTLAVIINKKGFQNKMSAKLNQKNNVCTEARDVGRKIRHSANFAVSNTDLVQYIDTLIDLMSDPKHLATYQTAKAAVDKLRQLKSNKLTISTADITTVLENALQDIVSRARDDALQAISKEKDEAQETIEEKAQQLLGALKDSLANTQSVTTCSLNQIIATKLTALNEIKMAADQEKQEIETIGAQQIQLIREETRQIKGGLESVARKPPGMIQTLFTKIRMPFIKKDLKEDLIRLYRQQYHSLPLSPLIEDQDTPLIKFYVMPDINSVEVKRSLGGGNEIKTEVTSLRDVFYKKNKKCREIYLSADAGFGKTAFSKRLVLTWCQSKNRIKSTDKYFKEEDIQVMSEFKFVFLLSLRDCSEECEIDEMIVKQIIPRLTHTSVTVSNIETIFSKEKCLVILDGLDEWIHPSSACKQGPSDIPHRKARECTILTTTRPWKLSVISLSSSQLDQKLELAGLNKTSAEELKQNVISLLTGKTDKEKYIQDFNSAVEHKGISDLENVPLLLMYLLCLWCDEIDLGRSKCGLYCQIVELLLKRTCRKYPVMQKAGEPYQSDIPQCFVEFVHCKKHFILLKAVGQLAFETLFSDKRENSLVFSQSVTERYLNIDDLKLCLLSGILAQSKQEKLTKQSSKNSFSHKSVQEYFCALYISCQNENDVQTFVLQRFNNVQNILDMSKVFVFTSGMNAEIMSSISRELMSVITKDQIVRRYRSMTYDEYKYAKPLIDIQNMYISCLKENTDNMSLCLQDFIIDEYFQKENYFSHLKRLAKHNKINLESICLKTDVPSLRELFDESEHNELVNIKKVYYEGEYEDEEIIQLLTNRSVECVTVLLKYTDRYWSYTLSQTFQNISHLRAIFICGFMMDHDVLNEFLNYIMNRKSMAEIRLSNLTCVTHDMSCEEINLDFSLHSDLRVLGLDDIPVSQLKVNVSSLEECVVGNLSKLDAVKSYLRQLPAARNLHSVDCIDLHSSENIEAMLQTLLLLIQVKRVRLFYLDLSETSLSLSPEMVNIECVVFYEVTLSGSSLRNLVKVIKNLPQTVTVDLQGCIITPETEFENVKKYIKTSESYVMIYDGNMANGMYSFEFKTIKLTTE